MLIIDDNLKSLVTEESICANKNLVETFCLQVRLSNNIYKLRDLAEGQDKIIRYGYSNDDIDDLYCLDDDSSKKSSITLKPGEQILACSHDRYKLPNDVFGLIQTKGSLARLFVQITCNDGQIEPGFEGHITLEIVNLSKYCIEIPFFSKVGQLYLFGCSMKTSSPYSGRYANSDFPTIPNFDGYEN
ncbi:dCTP deaminase [Pantoea leporis]|jgi:deoxycytidine triphosphate deaminase|uniref:dCTP deaminase n=1 Tax=Pantoea leporis TaxID=2933780 RepID=UPI002302F559|nr:hypothetical protein [Pantoea leporis]